ncbi:unnamed protein product [Oppiella nova]|uniref:NLE domain-containing protein n=1 Tax=Oppiella nova TaxID=334625 RepID=A0A7R9M667_9ACAR|nr:unnamed protein product [Oppiella nova]CAG2171511.1 unnamed protein product [Oppiella nova]
MSAQEIQTAVIQLKSESGQLFGSPFDIPLDITGDKLQLICNALVANERPVPYLFFANDIQITESLRQTIAANRKLFDTEKCLEIVCAPQAVFHVQAVSRCSSSIAGHSDAVVSVQFSPDGSQLASGSGDTTVRFWDVDTETPKFTGSSHKHWVLVIAWTPNGQRLASADRNGTIHIWDPKTGQQLGNALSAHKQWINSMVWEPFHCNPECRRLASASKDCSVKIWDTVLQKVVLTISGHLQSVTCVKWGGSGLIYTASQDRTVKVWTSDTGVLCRTLEGHAHWVNTLALSTDYVLRTIHIWDPKTGQQLGNALSAHKQWINSMVWEPFHCNPECRRLASASKDCSVKIWDTVLQKVVLTINGHLQSVTCVKWGGSGLIYTASQDRTVKVWTSDTGVLCRTLEGHAHWVNTLALSTDYVLRTACFDPQYPNNRIDSGADTKEMAVKAKERFQSVRSDNERLVSGSDDFTLFLWFPERDKKCVSRMTGHQQLINDVKFSPDARIIASASFDKSIKLWDGRTGIYLTSLRGHVKAVYQISWSADNRLLVSGSADSTLKVWDILNKKLLIDLPGHEDEVYAIDWSPDGERVGSGGKDKVLKLWKR